MEAPSARVFFFSLSFTYSSVPFWQQLALSLRRRQSSRAGRAEPRAISRPASPRCSGGHGEEARRWRIRAMGRRKAFTSAHGARSNVMLLHKRMSRASGQGMGYNVTSFVNYTMRYKPAHRTITDRSYRPNNEERRQHRKVCCLCLPYMARFARARLTRSSL